LEQKCVCFNLKSCLDMLRTAAVYEGWVRAAIISFKYEGERARAEHLAALAINLLPAFGQHVSLVPVPLHRKRERERGYNQSKLLADAIGRSGGIDVEQLLLRPVATPRQVGLSADERARNVADAFAVSTGIDLCDRRLILVDDVVTTGATLGACAETLKTAGAAWIGALTIAREQ
jgi:ComF family protein